MEVAKLFSPLVCRERERERVNFFSKFLSNERRFTI